MDPYSPGYKGPFLAPPSAAGLCQSFMPHLGGLNRVEEFLKDYEGFLKDPETLKNF